MIRFWKVKKKEQEQGKGSAVKSATLIAGWETKKLFTFLPIKMEQIECSETSAYKIQTPENHPEENIQHTEHGESLK
jgi:hypothetical protein